MVDSGEIDPADVTAARQKEAAGDLVGALDLYGRTRQFSDAARLAWSMGRPGEAAEFCMQGGMPFEAASCLFAAARPDEAVAQLTRVPLEHPRYREACVVAVEHSASMGKADLRLEALLARWLKDAPQSDRELAALYALGVLYQQAGLQAAARDALQKVVTASPIYADAAARLAQIAAQPLSAPLVPPPPTSSGVAQPLAGAPLSATPDDAMAEERAFRRSRRSRTATQLPAVAPIHEARTQVLADGGLPLPVSMGEPSMLEPGAVVADRYVLVRKIGQGGMAAVFEAMDQELGERVALKIFTQMLTDDDLKLRFKREVSLSRSLTHPNIIRVYDIGTVHGHKYMTMELLTGEDMERMLAERSAIDLRLCLTLLCQASDGLQHAHDKGVVHRDLKPANFYVTTEGVVKIMDFGIARDLRGPSHTAAGVVMGTPEYMSPEQFHEFHSVTSRTDIYALGAVTYHLVTGTLPFQHAELMKLAMMHYKEPVPSPRLRNQAIPQLLEDAIGKMMAKDPAERFATAAEVGQVLRQVLDQLQAG